MNITMVFTWVNYLHCWECKLIDNNDSRTTSKYYFGYGDSAITSLTEAVYDYNNHNEGKLTI